MLLRSTVHDRQEEGLCSSGLFSSELSHRTKLGRWFPSALRTMRASCDKTSRVNGEPERITSPPHLHGQFNYCWRPVRHMHAGQRGGIRRREQSNNKRAIGRGTEQHYTRMRGKTCWRVSLSTHPTTRICSSLIYHAEFPDRQTGACTYRRSHDGSLNIWNCTLVDSWLRRSSILR